MENIYIISFSRLSRMWSILNVRTRHIIYECSRFQGIFEKVKEMNAGASQLIFSDSAIDEISRGGA